MAIVLGPILSFRGRSKGNWEFSILVADTAAEAPQVDAAAGETKLKLTTQGLSRYPAARPHYGVWRFDGAVKEEAKEQEVEYSVGAAKFSFMVPKVSALPNMAYASCNGFSSLSLLKKTADPNELWRQVEQRHNMVPYHLLLMGGDQVYADSMWASVEALHEWSGKTLEQKKAAKFTKALAEKVDAFYADLYPSRWMQPEVRKMLASIPSVMMWDDHDIFDGWGSHREELQQCDVFKGIFATASRYFRLFQHHLGPTEAHPAAFVPNTLTLHMNLGDVHLLALDMRTERDNRQVIGFDSWKVIYDRLGTFDKPAHLIVMSSIPVVYPDFTAIESVLRGVPGDQELEDDLRDHWHSTPHKQERLRMIHRLLDFSNDHDCRVTIVSGDVHVGAVGVVRSTRTDGDPRRGMINQLTSSGIVHPSPPGVVLFFLESVMGRRTEEDPDLFSEMTQFPGTQRYYIGKRNWLSLEPDESKRYWAKWYTGAGSDPLTKVIHPIDYEYRKARVPALAEQS